MLTPDSLTKGRYLWVRPDAQSRWLWKHLGHYLADRTGLQLLFITSSVEDKRFYEAAFGIPFRGEIVVAADFYSHVVDGGDTVVDDCSVIRRGRAYERRHGINLMRHMILADRHLGRGFIIGAKGHPKSAISEKADLRRALEACLVSADFYDKLAERFPPVLVIGYSIGGGLSGKPLALLCRERGTCFRSIVSSRFGNLFFWATDEYARCPEFERFFRSFPAPNDSEVAAVQARLAPNALAGPEMLHKLRVNLRWSRIAKTSLYHIAHRIYAKTRGYRKAKIGYHVSATIAQIVRSRLYFDRLRRIGRRDLSGLEGRKLVFFPLQQEPESSTLVLTPYHSNQFAILLELALSMPADAILVVKEHMWQLGRRTRGFYEQILALPNVIMVDPTYPALDIIRRSVAVCAISSSAAHEAAVLGRPVFYFQKGSTLELLDHVYVVESACDLDRINESLEENGAEAERGRCRNGARYLLALEKFCFRIDGPSIALRANPPCEEELADMTSALLASLPDACRRKSDAVATAKLEGRQ